MTKMTSGFLRTGRLGGLSKTFWNLAETVAHEKHERKERRRGGPVVLLTDEQVIEARRLREHEKWGIKDLAAKFGVSDAYMRRLCDYGTRCKLFPPIRPSE